MPTLETLATRLLRFNRDVLAQAQELAAAHLTPGAPAYARPVGAHLRHVIEHYEALLFPPEPGAVDYDARPRDAALEQDPRIALQRLSVLSLALQGLGNQDLDVAVRVRGQGGLQGDFGFDVASSLERELVFAASHAVHHFAVLQPHCDAHALGPALHFGMAPATVAHERAIAVMKTAAGPTNPHLNEEVPCNTPTLACAAAN
jgi:hypothetical protein